MNPEQQHKTRKKLRTVLSPIAEEQGLHISAIEFGSDRRGPIVRIFLDGPQGVTISQCARFSRESSPILDVEDPISSAYLLEVSSPGIDRLLELSQDFERFKNFHVVLKILDRKKKLTGILGEQDDEGFWLLRDDAPEETPLAEHANAENNGRKINFEQLLFVRLNPTDEEFKHLAELHRQQQQAQSDLKGDLDE
jgi:ribosome maturation factor RimP